MEVSRQSVSKWESTSSTPDLKKIIGLANLFGVSTDFLLKDEVDTAEYLSGGMEPGVNHISLEQALTFVDNKMEVAALVVKGVALCVCSPVPLIFLLAMAQTNQMNLTVDIATAIGITAILVMVAAGVRFFVKTQQYDRDLAPTDRERFKLAYGVHSVFTEKVEKFTGNHHRRLSFSISMFIFSVIPLLLVAILASRSDTILMMLIVMFLMIAAGIYIIVPASTQFAAYNYILLEGDLDSGKTRAEKNAEKLSVFYWPLLVAIYLGWSLLTMNWGITWIIWPVGAITFGALIGLMGLFDKDER